MAAPAPDSTRRDSPEAAGEGAGAGIRPPPPAAVMAALAAGVELKRWWLAAAVGGGFARRFELARVYNRPDSSFGFFDLAEIGNRQLPVMGNFQRMFYDQPKVPSGRARTGEWMRRQVREFVLRYFMRVSAFRQPAGSVGSALPAPPVCLAPLSWCAQAGGADRGFGFQQLYYRRRDGGEIGVFPESERYAVVDLRELGKIYDWVVAKVSIFDFELDFGPLGVQGPRLALPLAEASYLVLSADFIVDEEEPAPGVLGRYGFGYAFVKNPRSGLLAYGPGEFDAAFELICFEVDDRGRVEVEMAFVANRPVRILSLPLNPMAWGARAAEFLSLGMIRRLPGPLRDALDRLGAPAGDVDPVDAYIAAANALSGGLAGSELCISREQLEKDFLLQHFQQHYQAVTGSLSVWRLVPDWLDSVALPRWVVLGRDA
jgi:hypothetical protein